MDIVGLCEKINREMIEDRHYFLNDDVGRFLIYDRIDNIVIYSYNFIDEINNITTGKDNLKILKLLEHFKSFLLEYYPHYYQDLKDIKIRFAYTDGGLYVIL